MFGRHKKDKGATTPTSKVAGDYFGVPIGEVLSRDGRSTLEVPQLVEQCIKHVETYGLDSEGIYRLSGSASTINQFKADYNNGTTVEFNSTTDPNAVAGLLKQWLRDLPEPVVPYNLYDVFSSVSVYRDEVSRSSYFRILVDNLPEGNRTLLVALLEHLIRVAEHSNVNKMKITNLALLFGPTMLRMEGETPMQMMQHTGAVCTAVNTLMTDYDAIFKRLPIFQMAGVARASYEFQAAQDNELPLTEGDIVFIEKFEDESEWLRGWYDDQSGLFPSNFVETLCVFNPDMPFEPLAEDEEEPPAPELTPEEITRRSTIASSMMGDNAPILAQLDALREELDNERQRRSTLELAVEMMSDTIKELRQQVEDLTSIVDSKPANGAAPTPAAAPAPAAEVVPSPESASDGNSKSTSTSSSTSD